VQEYLTIIGAHAPDAAVVIDTSPVKASVAEWARERLTQAQFFTGWTLALNPETLHDPGLGVDDARADLFENSMIGISDPPGTPEAVLTLSSDLVSLLGAKPFFLDAVEADGLIAMGHELPRVAALALLLATMDAPGWREGRKLAGPAYAKGTLPILSVSEREELGQSMILNQKNVVRLIDDLMQSLGEVRSTISEGDSEGLQKRIEAAINQRLLWLEQRRKMVWTGDGRFDSQKVDRPSLLGGWLGSKFKKSDDS
jgi:prephenate dehydrogenase